eukprot:jgi/Mesvir1/7369/Mv19171-RA.1
MLLYIREESSSNGSKPCDCQHCVEELHRLEQRVADLGAKQEQTTGQSSGDILKQNADLQAQVRALQDKLENGVLQAGSVQKELEAKVLSLEPQVDFWRAQARRDSEALEVNEKGHQQFKAKAVEVERQLQETQAREKELLETRDGEGNTALHLACGNNRLDIVKWLVAAGADLDAQNKDALTPLHHGSMGGHLAVVQHLVGKGANKDAQGKVSGRLMTKKGTTGNTALHLAARKGHTEIVKHLIASGANKEIQNQDAYTPLHEACVGGHLAVVQHLVENSANKDAKDKNGKTAVDLAQGKAREFLTKK